MKIYYISLTICISAGACSNDEGYYDEEEYDEEEYNKEEIEEKREEMEKIVNELKNLKNTFVFKFRNNFS